MLSCWVGFQEAPRQESLGTCRYSEKYCFHKFQVKAGGFILTKDQLPMAPQSPAYGADISWSIELLPGLHSEPSPQGRKTENWKIPFREWMDGCTDR